MSKAHVWKEDLPIYRQIVDEILARVRDGTHPEGEQLLQFGSLPNFQVNPLTVAKALRKVAKEDLTEKRRGIGLVVRSGAQAELQKREKVQFLDEEWPQLVAGIERMGIDINTPLKA